MYRFLAEYEHDLKTDKSKVPKNNQQKIDQWVIRYSNIIQKNIKPQFESFGLPVSEEVDKQVKKYPEWSLVDELKNPSLFFQN